MKAQQDEDIKRRDEWEKLVFEPWKTLRPSAPYTHFSWVSPCLVVVRGVTFSASVRVALVQVGNQLLVCSGKHLGGSGVRQISHEPCDYVSLHPFVIFPGEPFLVKLRQNEQVSATLNCHYVISSELHNTVRSFSAARQEGLR